MKEKQRITAFYMELLVLTVVFVAVILLLTQVFALAKEKSNRAQILTQAVALAENSAEIVASAEEEELLELFGGESSAAWIENGSVLQAAYDEKMCPLPEGDFQLKLAMEPDHGLKTCVISVYWQKEEEPVYTLETAIYHKEE